jgi:hypothetical protein
MQSQGFEETVKVISSKEEEELEHPRVSTILMQSQGFEETVKVNSSTDERRRTISLGFGWVTNKCGVGEEYIFFSNLPSFLCEYRDFFNDANRPSMVFFNPQARSTNDYIFVLATSILS